MNEDMNQVTSQSASVPSKIKSGITNWFRKSTDQPLKAYEKVVLVVVAVLALFIFYVALDANKYRATVHVIEGEGKVGVNPTDLALDFGDLSRGTSAVRRVDLQNGTFMPMYVFMIKTGDISSLVKIDKNNFRLNPREQTKIEYTVYIPASAPVDATYNGRVYLFKVPTFGL